MDDMVFRYIGTLGFPIAVAVAMGWVLWKIGNRLVAGHTNFLDATVKATAENAASNTKAATALASIAATLPTMCQANCPAADHDNYRPRPQPPSILRG